MTAIIITPQQAIETLQQAALNCQHHGIKVKASQLYASGVPCTALLLENVELIDGKLTLVTSKEQAS